MNRKRIGPSRKTENKRIAGQRPVISCARIFHALLKQLIWLFRGGHYHVLSTSSYLAVRI